MHEIPNFSTDVHSVWLFVFGLMSRGHCDSQRSEKPRFFKKAQPTGFFGGFYWVFGFLM